MIFFEIDFLQYNRTMTHKKENCENWRNHRAEDTKNDSLEEATKKGAEDTGNEETHKKNVLFTQVENDKRVFFLVFSFHFAIKWIINNNKKKSQLSWKRGK